MHDFVGAGPGSIPLTNPQGRAATPNPLPAMPTLAATCPHVLVQRVNCGGIDLLDPGSAEIRQDVAIDSAAIVGNGDRRDRPDLLTPAEPALD